MCLGMAWHAIALDQGTVSRHVMALVRGIVCPGMAWHGMELGAEAPSVYAWHGMALGAEAPMCLGMACHSTSPRSHMSRNGMLLH